MTIPSGEYNATRQIVQNNCQSSKSDLRIWYCALGLEPGRVTVSTRGAGEQHAEDSASNVSLPVWKNRPATKTPAKRKLADPARDILIEPGLEPETLYV